MSLRLESVHKKYGEKTVLRGIDLEIEKGTFLALLGPSGCGKTTLLQSIAGLTSINEGKIAVDGVVLSEPGKEVPIEKRQIGMVFQDFALWPHMTVFEIVAFGLKLQGLKGQKLKDRVIETLSIFHMEDYLSAYPHEISGGQKQRIAMARAIAPNPRLILMDEPLSALDTGLREEMRVELVRIFKSLDMTVVYVTHDQAEAMSMADRIAVLKDGQLEQMGTPEELYHQPVSEYVAKFMGPANILHHEGQTGMQFVRPDAIGITQNGNDGLEGTVLVRTYLGSHYRYFVSVKGFEEPLQITSSAKIELNARVRVHLPSDIQEKLMQTV